MTKGLSQKEIWDDSALQNSWNEALQEYNRYHSIHARGEKVQDVLEESENGNGATGAENPDVEINMNGHDGLEVKEENGENSNIPTTSAQEKKNDSNSASAAPPGMPGLPENLIGAVHDEDLKKLLMSWYYSGYYTGYYEGKQAARSANPTA